MSKLESANFLLNSTVVDSIVNSASNECFAELLQTASEEDLETELTEGLSDTTVEGAVADGEICAVELNSETEVTADGIVGILSALLHKVGAAGVT